MAILCIIDGMTDERFSLWDYPNLSAMANAGAYGTLKTVPTGFQAETLTCVMTLLGIEPENIPRKSRGWLEAVGSGIAVRPDDLVLRGSWVSLDPDGRVQGITDAPASIPRFACKYIPLTGYKAILIAGHMADHVQNVVTYPPHSHCGAHYKELVPSGLAVLAETVAQSAADGRALIPWGESCACRLPPLAPGTAAVSATPVVRGLLSRMGADLIDLPGATGDTDTNLSAKLAAVLEAAEKYPLVILHINGADEAGHRRSVHEKREFLQRVDREVFARLITAGERMLICSDHATSPAYGMHSGTPQPFVLFGAARTGDIGYFDSASALSLLGL